MKTAIAYTRVSTKQQGNSGLGLAAQCDAIKRYARDNQINILSWHEDVQTGKGADPLPRRPGLRAALEAARKAKATLLVSKLDRLARDSNFITGLMGQGVRFIVTSMPDADEFTLQIYAALAEKERKQIAQRTKDGLAVAKARGQKLGMANKPRELQASYRARALPAAQQAANDNAEALRPQIEFALKNGASLRQAAQTLNDRRVKPLRRGQWYPITVLKVARRLGLRPSGASP